ncbi:leucine--tRNA ligase, partial [Streptococcus suis]
LIDDLKTVDYLDRIASQQINWIGRSEGAEIDFVLNGLEAQLTVYTTRPDTIFGASFLVASPEVVRGWMNAGWTAPKDVDKYVTKAINTSELQRQEEKVKTGVDTGVKAVHPLTADQIPVWVADYVLGSYGTGAIMAVPG